MTNQQGAPEALVMAAQAVVEADDEQALTQNLIERLRAALVEAQQPAAHVQNPAETEHVAGDVSKNGPESNTAQQPAPSAAAGYVIDLIGKLVQAESNKTRTHQEYMGKAMPDDVYGRFQRLRDETIPALRTQLLDALATLPSPSPTPKADSQPAPAATFEVADAMADSQYLAGVSAGWNAANADDPNAALQKLHESRAGYLKPLSAARAPADSVTAPAAFQRALDIRAAQGWKLGGDKVPVLYTDTINGEQVCRDDIWLCTTAAFSTPPTQAADSVLEDAARWQELREQHEDDAAERCCVFAPNDMRECLVPVGSLPGELDAFMDSERAARKRGANHD